MLRPKAYWLNQTWNRLQLAPNQQLPEQFNQTLKKFEFICSCGNRKQIAFSSVLSGRTQSCGCLSRELNHQKKLKDLTGRKFWNLTVTALHHKDARGRSFWLCRCLCGTDAVVVSAGHLLSGHTKSCGCLKHVGHRFVDLATQQFGILTAVEPQGVGQGGKYKWRCRCSCGNETVVYGDSLLQGLTKSCGCARPGYSEFSPAHDLYRFIQSLAADAEMEVPMGSVLSSLTVKFRFDIWVPSQRIAVEYHGLYWHQEDRRGLEDYEKYTLCSAHGIRLIQIYEDEWRDRRSVMEDFLRRLLLPACKGKRIQPVFDVLENTTSISRKFLNQYHYLGAASGELTVTAQHPSDHSLVGCWVFQRRDAKTALWHRACWNHRYRAWNPHSAALRLAVPALRERGYEKIVSFSDNRFHNGELYQRLGFILEANVKPNYYYVNSKGRRLSKYALRVPAGTDERATAQQRGWYRLWDSGKKRWGLPI